MNLRDRIRRLLRRPAPACEVDIVTTAYRMNAEQRRRLRDVRALEAERDVIRADRRRTQHGHR